MILFQPVQVGSLTLKNRIVMPALHHNYTPGGMVNEKLIRYYEARARGGAGLIIIGGCSVDQAGGGPQMIGLHDDKFIPGLEQLTGTIKDAGAQIAAQLYQAGRYTHRALTGVEPLAPSAIPSRLFRDTPREMTAEDIEGVIEGFATAALRAKEAGFDAVEVIASAGYLICQFLSPVTNIREDHYGGSFDNRSRFGVEVLRRVREKVGNDFTVLVRLSGHDFIPEGNTNTEAAQFAALLEEAGADGFNVTGGWHESRIPQITGHLPRGGYAYLARGIKEAVGVPVIAGNRINDPATAEQILIAGFADLISMGRALIADPDMPRKTLSGEGQIRRCIACNQGCLDSVFTMEEVFCAVNAHAGKESEVELTPAANPKKVLVVGAGPAGLEASLTAARRGHRVTLWEKGPRAGGQLHYASRPPGKGEFITLLDYYGPALAAAGVETVFNHEATADKVIEYGADAVIIATGARPAPPPFPVDEAAADKVVSAFDILSGKAIPGKEVVVAGGGSVGCETALTIASLGTIDAEALRFLMEYEAETPETLQRLLTRGTRKVVIVEVLDKIGRDFGITTRWIVQGGLRRLGVEVITGAKILEVKEDHVVIEKKGASEEGGPERMQLPADTVVVAVGAKSVGGTLYEELQDKVPLLHRIGDAAKPRKLTEAIREGFTVGRELE